MRKILLTLAILSIGKTSFCTVWTITSPNTSMMYTPDSITIIAGDTVRFFIGNKHDAVEVSKGNWDTVSNTGGIAPLPGGFSLPNSGGYVYPPKLGLGVHYYVCTPHISSGQKGRIFVTSPSTVNHLSVETNLFAIFPNPLSEKMNVRYTVKQPCRVQLKLYDITGKEIPTLFSETQAAGLYNCSFDMDRKRLAKGTYVVELILGDIRTTKEIIIE